MFSLFIRTRNVKAMRELLEAYAEAVSDLRVFRDELEEEFYTVEREQFATQGGLSGGWPALSPRYQAWKDRYYPGAPILVLSGRLKRSLTQRTSDTIFRVNAKSIRMGTRVPYASRHRTGEGRMPARDPLPQAVVMDRLVRVVEAKFLDIEQDARPTSEE